MERYSAVFDGKVFVPEEPVELAPNSRVRVTADLTSLISKEERRIAFESLLQRPAHGGGFDWAEWDRGDVYP